MRENARFSAGFDGIGEAVVGSRVRIEQAVERRIEIIFGTVLQQMADEVGELLFPEQIFQLAARFGEASGEPPEFGGVGGNALAGGKTVTFHGDETLPAEESVIVPAPSVTIGVASLFNGLAPC